MFEQFISAHLLAPEYLGWLGQGFVITLLISFWTILAATLLGFLLVAGRPARTAPLVSQCLHQCIP